MAPTAIADNATERTAKPIMGTSPRIHRNENGEQGAWFCKKMFFLRGFLRDMYSSAITTSYGSARTPQNAGRLRLRVLRAGVRAQGVDVRRDVIGLVPDDLLFEMLEVRPFQGRFEWHDREFALVVIVFGLGAVFNVQPVAATDGNDEAVRHGVVVVLLPRLLDGQHVVEIE